MEAPRIPHPDAVDSILCYLKCSLSHELLCNSYGYIVAIHMQNGRLPSDQQLAIVHLLVVFSNLENKMHKVVARWSVEAEY